MMETERVHLPAVKTATAAAPSSSATSLSNGLTEADVQNQVLAAGAINQQQLQNDVQSF
jgi:hypothetical protein